MALHWASICSLSARFHCWNSCWNKRLRGVSEVLVSRFWFQLHVYPLIRHVCVSVCFWVAIESRLLWRAARNESANCLQPTGFLLSQPEGAVALFCRSLFLFFPLLSSFSAHLKSNSFTPFQCSFSYVGVLCGAAQCFSERYKRRSLMIFWPWFG